MDGFDALDVGGKQDVAVCKLVGYGFKEAAIALEARLRDALEFAKLRIGCSLYGLLACL